MKSLLKTETMTVGEGDRAATVTIRELSVAKSNELLAFQGQAENKAHVAAMACKLGVVEWANETVEDIEDAVSWKHLAELQKHINRLSGLRLEGDVEENRPNSEPAPSASSSTA